MKLKISILLIIIVLLIGGSIYLFWNLNSESDYISIPVASKNINLYTEITEDDIKYISVYKELVTDNVITDASKLIGKTVISMMEENAFFYDDILIEDAFDLLEHDELFIIDVSSAYQSVIEQYEYVDIWLTGEIDNSILMVSWIENVQVLYYLDEEEQLVTETEEISKIALNVSDDIYEKLTSVMEDGRYNLEIVIKNTNVSTDNKNEINDVVEQTILNNILN